MSYTQDTEALTVNTTNTIHGSGPYLTFDGGRTKATNTDTFLAIELPDGRRITQSTNTSSVTNPIRLPSGNYTFNDIYTVLPSGTTSISLNSLISQGKWGDDDGDGQGTNGVTASGSISLVIKDKDGATVSRSDAINLCKAPYKVTLDSTGGSLTTQYGVPNSSRFYGGTVDYYITLPSQPVICSVRPNLYFGGTGVRVFFPWNSHPDDPHYAGPSNIWNPNKGFLTQSTNPSSYELNFPTTGLDGLYFDLDIGGIDASQLNWTVNTSGSLGATVRWTRPLTGTFTSPDNRTIQADEWIRDKSKNVTRVTLTGPRASSSQISSSNPGSLTRPSLPQTFELVGRDSNGNEVRYGFKLRQWFVNRDNQLKIYSNQLAWCNSLGYRMPQVRDLVNSNYSNSGAAPRSSVNAYMRHIGAGFFTEWGIMFNYADAGFVFDYWTSNAVGGNRFAVTSDRGEVRSYIASLDSAYAVCTAP
ncbi:hypothetical protein [Gilliamella sp. Gris1-4]|uniref:hypothetical protein n=1 Tax=Gilliamella sp. Gris1-4 TaxID=3120244 RepID=UPI00080EB6F6|nr:hypothetical protein [Gilliamella apicola]OCG36146.1 hypothetical protein A9G31_06530 [Gilliamella apicola]